MKDDCEKKQHKIVQISMGILAMLVVLGTMFVLFQPLIMSRVSASSSNITQLACSSGGDIVYMVKDGSLLQSTDYGKTGTWYKISTYPN